MSDVVSSFVIKELTNKAKDADANPHWPGESWSALKKSEALKWCIPGKFGGAECSRTDLLAGYEQLAGACLTTCFVLSQRDAAIRRLCGSGRDDLCQRLLPDLASGKTFTTVGLAQLTTSHQHGEPAVTATINVDELHIDGVIPWVTGADRADFIITGAVVKNAGQILIVLPMDTPGVTVEAPLDLMAMQGTITAEVRCDGVTLPRHWLLKGPAERVLAGTGGLETSCLALGLAGAAVRHLSAEAENRPFLKTDADRLDQFLQKLRDELHRLAQAEPTAEEAMSLRARANTLVLQATQTALAASKGAGFLRDHPAQRWARQALFFLVWSCPGPAVAQTMGYFAAAGEQICG